MDLELEDDICERLGRLPADLKEAYDDIYSKIQNSKGSKPVIAARAFQWIMCSAVPLRADALVAVVCQDPEDDKTQQPPRMMSIDFVLDACRNLVVSDRRTNVCRLSHLSAREYFKENHWSIDHANVTLAKVCLLLLNDLTNWGQGGCGPLCFYKNDQLGKIIDYAVRHWYIHVRNREDADRITNARLSALLEEFIGDADNSAPAFKNWYDEYRRVPRDLEEDTDLPISLDDLDRDSPLLFVCVAG